MERIWPNNSLCLPMIGHQLLYYIVLSIVMYINSRVFEILDRAKMRVRTFILPLSKGTYLHFTPIQGNVPLFYPYPRVRTFILPLSKGTYLHFWREVLKNSCRIKLFQTLHFLCVFTKLSRNQLKGNFEIWFNI